MKKDLHITLVAGETSGDMLGASLMSSLKSQYPDCTFHFSGIAGPKMQALGCETFYEQERLAVMGFGEVIKRLPELLRIQYRSRRVIAEQKPDVFIGIDAPDFNLPLEHALKKQGIKTVHYSSPTIWAWKEKRVFKIAKAVDLMLCLFPFEPKYYVGHHTKACFIGHQLADEIPLETDTQAAREKFALDKEAPTLAILPGSRRQELHYVLEPFLRGAQLCKSAIPNLQLIAPVVNDRRLKQFEQIKAQIAPELDIKVVVGDARSVMQAADVVLICSGTATLECMLLKKPMVVGYRMSAFNYAIASRLVKTPYVSLPNILADDLLVPELIQEDLDMHMIAARVLHYFKHSNEVEQLVERFTEVHKELQQDSSAKAANAVMELIEKEV